MRFNAIVEIPSNRPSKWLNDIPNRECGLFMIPNVHHRRASNILNCYPRLKVKFKYPTLAC